MQVKRLLTTEQSEPRRQLQRNFASLEFVHCFMLFFLLQLKVFSAQSKFNLSLNLGAILHFSDSTVVDKEVSSSWDKKSITI